MCRSNEKTSLIFSTPFNILLSPIYLLLFKITTMTKLIQLQIAMQSSSHEYLVILWKQSVNGLLLSLETLKNCLMHLMIHCRYLGMVIPDHKVYIKWNKGQDALSNEDHHSHTAIATHPSEFWASLKVSMSSKLVSGMQMNSFLSLWDCISAYFLSACYANY